MEQVEYWDIKYPDCECLDNGKKKGELYFLIDYFLWANNWGNK